MHPSRPCLLVALLLGACAAPPLDNPDPPRPPPGLITEHWPDKADILFVVDNSYGMEAMATALREGLPALFQPLQDSAARGVPIELHLGVITTDYGAGSTGAPGCNPSPGGQAGRLQAIGLKAPPGCKRPGNGLNFVDYHGPDRHNLPPGQGLTETLRCMMSVGSSGCGFEHPLEAAYAALRNSLPENDGFLREDATLVVIFFTNEDDASAPPETDLFDKTKVGEYGYEGSYSRQTRFAVRCCPPGRDSCAPDELQFPPYADSGGPLAGCRPAPNDPAGAGPGKQYDARRYVDLFTKPSWQGGIKSNPDDLILVAIDGPEAPFQVTLGNPANGEWCPRLDEGTTPPCVPVLAHSCANPGRAFFGDPAIRLDAVVRAVKSHLIGSICDDDYSATLRAVAAALIDRAGHG